jgi:purine-binding chemotaxis protein CheW
VVPVVDLRLKFGLPELEHTERTCIIVVQIEVARIEVEGSGHLQMGVIVDAVTEVLTLQSADIENTPDFGGGVALPYLLGMAKIKGQVKILLDINGVLSAQEAASLRSL